MLMIVPVHTAIQKEYQLQGYNRDSYVCKFEGGGSVFKRIIVLEGGELY